MSIQNETLANFNDNMQMILSSFKGIIFSLQLSNPQTREAEKSGTPNDDLDHEDDDITLIGTETHYLHNSTKNFELETATENMVRAAENVQSLFHQLQLLGSLNHSSLPINDPKHLNNISAEVDDHLLALDSELALTQQTIFEEIGQ
eukprot:TRINITY_DN11637_c0_g1_i1.p1 TRINITY_DN11637_c0_g1~~TRINITY_DN11637_c0_g1_i1.p1  ORF type:complete len:154 (+),score=62.49 TRINITY_DN11637_c0_g1_i1:22-462(+)